MELIAQSYADQYRCAREFRNQGVIITPRINGRLKCQARRALVTQWQSDLLAGRYAYGQRVVKAIAPCLLEWLDREHGGVSYHVVYVITGHGCFGDYLCRIGKERTTRCYCCRDDRDSAQHTLAECPAWAGECVVLTAELGEDLSLPTVTRTIVGNGRAWRSFASFCGRVLTQKKAMERERRGEVRVSSSALGQDEPVAALRPLPRRGLRRLMAHLCTQR